MASFHLICKNQRFWNTFFLGVINSIKLLAVLIAATILRLICDEIYGLKFLVGLGRGFFFSY